MKKIRVEISKSADVTVSVEGASGGECAALTQSVEQALGVVSDQTKTPEWYAATASQNVEVRK